MYRKEIVNELSDLYENNHFDEMIYGQLIHYRENPEDSNQSIRCENYRIVVRDTYTREDIVFDINLKQLGVRDHMDKSSYFFVLQDESGDFHMLVMGFTQKYIEKTIPQQNPVSKGSFSELFVPEDSVSELFVPEDSVFENPVPENQNPENVCNNYVKRTNFTCCDTEECMVGALCDDCKKYYVKSPGYFVNESNVVEEIRSMHDLCWLRLSKDPDFTFQVIESVCPEKIPSIKQTLNQFMKKYDEIHFKKCSLSHGMLDFFQSHPGMKKYLDPYKEQYSKELERSAWPTLFKSEYNLKCVNKYFTQIFRKLTENEMTEEQKESYAFRDSYHLGRHGWGSEIRNFKKDNMTERDKLFIKRKILIQKLKMVDQEIVNLPEDLIDLPSTVWAE